MRFQDTFKAVPAALQRQILRRGLMGCAFFIFALLFLVLGYDAQLILPGIGLALFGLGGAIWLFYIADRNRYVVVEGVCTEVTKSLLFKRVKSVLLVSEGRTLRIQLKQHGRSFKAGARLRLYMRENAKVYERDDELLIYDYILIEQRPASPH